MINLLLKAFNIIFKTREGGRVGKKKGKKEEIEGEGGKVKFELLTWSLFESHACFIYLKNTCASNTNT